MEFTLEREEILLNKVILLGRIVRDPEVRHTQKSHGLLTVASFTLAVPREYNREEADFIKCVAFGVHGEFVEKYCKKGMKILLEGRWKTGSYINDDNKTVYTNSCVVDTIEFAESKKSGYTANSTDENRFHNYPEDFMKLPDELEDYLPFK